MCGGYFAPDGGAWVEAREPSDAQPAAAPVIAPAAGPARVPAITPAAAPARAPAKAPAIAPAESPSAAPVKASATGPAMAPAKVSVAPRARGRDGPRCPLCRVLLFVRGGRADCTLCGRLFERREDSWMEIPRPKEGFLKPLKPAAGAPSAVAAASPVAAPSAATAPDVVAVVSPVEAPGAAASVTSAVGDPGPAVAELAPHLAAPVLRLASAAEAATRVAEAAETLRVAAASAARHPASAAAAAASGGGAIPFAAAVRSAQVLQLTVAAGEEAGTAADAAADADADADADISGAGRKLAA
ncbi:MAG: hypothetical protein N3A38_09245, partial [Planctomycetota bacterium]|nr:hypothetical protein [Planctomycetota bacterium]